MDMIAATVREIAATRRGRLVAVTVVSPPGMSADAVVATVSGLLERAGFAGVAVRTLPSLGPFRLVSAEFER